MATREDDDSVEVRVRDNGTGIPPGIKDKLFQPFFTTKPTGEGTGLRLSISYDIVTQQHGGTIEVASEEGVYTEFTIRLADHSWKHSKAWCRAVIVGGSWRSTQTGAILATPALQERGSDMKVLIKSAWGSDDPTKAAFAFLHANAFAEAGHEVQIFLLGEAVSLMKDELMMAVTPVGWPPLSEIMPRSVAHNIPIHV